MTIIENKFSDKKVAYYFDTPFSFLETIVPKKNTIIITDKNIFNLHQQKFDSYKTIVIKAGEEHKQQSTIDFIIKKLIEFEADRKSFIVGVGGGVVTDITGYAASVYMRGVKFGFVPTTILAMVDAAIGGKNGVDVGVYKNLVGFIKQPEFLLFDYCMLQTLPNEHWINGFAEIIKHACIKDENLFTILEQHDLQNFKTNAILLAKLIEQNVSIKTNVVINDEFEQGDRKLLNFGHTIGHAIENNHQLLHGHAVAIGMIAAAKLSNKINGFAEVDVLRLQNFLKKYHLSTTIASNTTQVFDILKMDKKRTNKNISFVLLNKIGEAIIKEIELEKLQQYLNEIL